MASLTPRRSNRAQSTTSEASNRTVTASNATHTRHASHSMKPFKCTYEGCKHRFDTEKDMKRHKKYDPDHYYCKKCDVDCENWEELTRHKVEKMAPYILGEMKAREGEMPAHIVCEFCGEDFKSFGGRKLHRRQAHPAEQEVKCPGCSSIYGRASEMVDHLEKGRCEGISGREFYLKVQHKYINTQIMPNPHLIYESLNPSEDLSPQPGNYDQITDGTETHDQEEGGVSLLDQPNPNSGYYKALEPEVRTEQTRENLETWPRLSGKGSSRSTASTTSELDQSLRSMSISSGRKDSVVYDGMESTNTAMATQPWTGSGTSKKLFPKANPELQAGDWKAILRKNEEDARLADDSHLLKARWWDPGSSEYKVDRFFNPLLQRYCCPFLACQNDNVVYLAASDIEDHIVFAHFRRIISCPVCFKRFNSCQGLVSHSESTQSCTIGESKHFKEFIDDISGGFLTVKHVPEKKIYRPETDVAKPGQSMGGVMSTRFIGKQPHW